MPPSAPGTIRLCAPHGTPVYRSLNGKHPLVHALFGAPASPLALIEALEEPTPATIARTQRDVASVTADLAATGVSASEIAAFVTARDPASQALIPEDVDLVLHHTAPATLGARPWALHVEVTGSLFLNALAPPPIPSVSLAEQSEFRLVRRLLDASNCRFVFSNLARTVEEIKTAFSGTSLPAKVHHIAPGVEIPPAVAARAVQRFSALAAGEGAKGLAVLYTASWNRDPLSFYLRGGHEVLAAFSEIAEFCPGLTLTLCGPLPETLDPALLNLARTHPRVTLIPQPLSDAELFDQLLAADVFVAPSVAVTTVSTLRAMACGAVMITADPPGVEEMINHDVTGFVLPGKSATIDRREGSTGIYLADPGLANRYNAAMVQGLSLVLKGLHDHSKKRCATALRAKAALDQRFSLEGWRSGFAELAAQAMEKRSDI
ncbi:MAG: hypothetical protein A2516_08110 [Alphaproteobacteria bacterium RIFOXYD12_FULL_60_8]|nr:MAG: hypothetical protein A2516_08110 [Alphaproteobacteria bacterium RIFOXYD12_FULL_60_8]